MFTLRYMNSPEGRAMKTSTRTWLMRGFIASVFLLCLLGPYGISILIGCLGLGCYVFRDEAGSHL